MSTAAALNLLDRATNALDALRRRLCPHPDWIDVDDVDDLPAVTATGIGRLRLQRQACTGCLSGRVVGVVLDQGATR